jgi:hypothetical protein
VEAVEAARSQIAGKRTSLPQPPDDPGEHHEI